MENQNKKKISLSFLILAMALIIVLSLFLLLDNSDKNDNSNDYNNSNNNNKTDPYWEFNQCLADNGVIIYGTGWCPACRQLVESLGGYENISPVYVDCMDEKERCDNEKKTGYIPEIQIEGKLYESSRSLESLSQLTGCPLPN